MSHTTLTGFFLAFLIHVVILKDLVYVSIRTLYWVILSSSCLNQVTKNASKVILFNDLAYHFLKIPIQIISNGKFSHYILDTLFSLYFANNPKSILHQFPPFYVKQFSVLESLHFWNPFITCNFLSKKFQMKNLVFLYDTFFSSNLLKKNP